MIFFRSNITPDIRLDFKGPATTEKSIIGKLLRWAKPSVVSDNTFLPIEAHPYGTPTANGDRNFKILMAVGGALLGLAVVGALVLGRKYPRLFFIAALFVPFLPPL